MIGVGIVVMLIALASLGSNGNTNNLNANTRNENRNSNVTANTNTANANANANANAAELISGVVRTVTRETAWTAELLDPHPAEKRPRPFKELEHEFATFEAVLEWLGGPAVYVKPERKAA